ncbi:hypothetical protein GCM10011365_19710 [Marinicella pacifica]|uniref:Uncharacterized protein n=1 Tax=Marinicella pacifica TaxID=1171543 RepID=A0A917CUZ9_9GAMM|nr:hypothetical protein [Marinicella pacifica]GGF98512.1 hypothetical protein GCM10011365_19710 [Marinicella pacifica]
MILRVLILFLCSTGAWGQQLLSNGHFTQGVSPWDNPSHTPQWLSNDGHHQPGAISFSDNFNNGGSIYMYSEKIPVIPNYHYLLGTSYKYPSSATPAYMNMIVEWYDANDVNVATWPWHTIFDMSQPDTWLDFDGEVSNEYGGGVFARVVLTLQTQSSGTANNEARYDDVLFYQDTVFMTDFE